MAMAWCAVERSIVVSDSASISPEVKAANSNELEACGNVGDLDRIKALAVLRAPLFWTKPGFEDSVLRWLRRPSG